MLKVEEILRSKNIPYRLLRLTQEAFTVEDVRKYSQDDFSPEEVCKTIILRGKKSGNGVAIFLRGDDKLDFSKAKRLFGEEMAIAQGEYVKQVSGVEPGAVCPFMLEVPLCLDQRVSELSRVNCGSGHHLNGLEFELKDLSKVKEFKIIEISKPWIQK